MKTYLKDNFEINTDLISVIDELSIWSAPFGVKLLDTINMKSHLNVLDIGFGTGFPLLEIAQRLGPTCNVSGIDPWDEAHERTKLKIEQYGLKNVNLFLGKAEKMPFANNIFDLIVSNNGLNNVENEEKAYRECFRVCNYGGQFVFTFNLPESMIEFYNVFEQVLKNHGKSNEIKAMYEHINHKRKTIEETSRMVKEAGFSISDVKTDSFKWRYTDGTSMLNHFFIRLAFLDAWKEIIKPSDKEIIFDEIENILNKIANEKGEFSMTIPYAVFNCRKLNLDKNIKYKNL
jgi:ubiquinone/menaquinone biosynthesis C-methylase UbiE